MNEYKVGNIIKFGKYPLNGNTSNGKEDIEWEILSIDNNKALIFSKYILDCVCFNEGNGNRYLTWENSNLRNWLNNTFFDEAFDEFEKKKIQSVTLENINVARFEGYPETVDATYTNDKVFCLSICEIEKYYGINLKEEIHCQKLICEPTQFAINNGARVYKIDESDYNDYMKNWGYTPDIIGKGVCSWWLRSPVTYDEVSDGTNSSSYINRDCDVDSWGNSVEDELGVRPALVIKLDSSDSNQDKSSYRLMPETLDVKQYIESIVDFKKVFDRDHGFYDDDDDDYEDDRETILFGRYIQRENSSPQPIEWLVLKRENGCMLLVSKFLLDCMAYNTECSDVTWENCSLRKWLNEKFLNEAFNMDEQEKIINSVVKADKNPEYDTQPGNDTSDKVFLLSLSEYEHYLDEEGNVETTKYYDSKLADLFFWLRTPGESSKCATAVCAYDGEVEVESYEVSEDDFGVRPAMWVKEEL